MKFPVIELVDRYAIAVVKHSMTGGENQAEVDFYIEQLQQANINPYHELIDDLVDHHRYVWSLEDDFKKGRIDELPLDEIGRRAIIIRDAGHHRQTLKNKLAELAGHDDVREVKK